MDNLIVGAVVVVLIAVYVWLKKSQSGEHKETNLPAVSEDVNLPSVSEPNPPAAQPDGNLPPQQN